MIDQQTLIELCRPLYPTDPFFRPFICRGALDSVQIAVVGANPATPIPSSHSSTDNRSACKYSLEDYASRLLNYTHFHNMYADIRYVSKGKPAPIFGKSLKSTRDKVFRLVSEIEKERHVSVLETNVNAFPTKNEEEFDAVARARPDILKRGSEVFVEVVNSFQPRLFIAHGARAIVAVQSLTSVKWQNHTPDPWSVVKANFPRPITLSRGSYSNRNETVVIGCYHFTNRERGFEFEKLVKQLVGITQLELRN